MNLSKIEKINQLKRLVVNQKSAHLTPPDKFPKLAPLYEAIRLYDEHLSKLVFSVLRGEGVYLPFPGIAEFNFAAEEVLASDESAVKRIGGVYLRYKEQLDEIDVLVQEILEPDLPKGG